LDIPEADTGIHEAGSSYQENTRSTSPNALSTVPRKSPFVDAILKVPLPGTWNNPTLNKYDETIDPNEHVNAYLTQVILHMAEDALWCRIFPTSLKDATLN